MRKHAHTSHMHRKSRTKRALPTDFSYLEDGSVAITTTRGDHVLLVDEEDLDLMMSASWTVQVVQGRIRQVYCTRHHIKMNVGRFILNPEANQRVNHKNGDILDNRRANLIVSDCIMTTQWGKVAATPSTAPVEKITYRGVRKLKDGLRNPYQAYIKVGRKEEILGRYHTPEGAAAAHDVRALELFGEDTLCNL